MSIKIRRKRSLTAKELAESLVISEDLAAELLIKKQEQENRLAQLVPNYKARLDRQWEYQSLARKQLFALPEYDICPVCDKNIHDEHECDDGSVLVSPDPLLVNGAEWLCRNLDWYEDWLYRRCCCDYDDLIPEQPTEQEWEKTKNLSPHIVYAVVDSERRVKVGVTATNKCFESDGMPKIEKCKASLNSRLSSIQTGNPNKVKVVGLGIHDPIPEVPSYEKWFHRKFKEFQLNGEWFDLKPVIMQIIEDFLSPEVFWISLNCLVQIAEFHSILDE